MRDVGGVFGITQFTVCRVINKVLDFFVDLAPQYIFFPRTTMEKEKSATDFEEVNISFLEKTLWQNFT